MYFPVTTFYAALLGVLFFVLSARVSLSRRQAKVSLGTGDDESVTRTSRAHGNFAEYVPLGLILLLLLELEMTEMWLLHTLGAMLLVGRLLHGYGMSRQNSVNFGRTWGTALTWLMILVTSLLNLWHLV